MGRLAAGGEAKKLIGAAEHWVRGAPDTSSLEREAEAYGVILPEQSIRPQAFEVFPENWPAVQMFLRVGTQWRVGPRGPIGLDYRALEWLLSLYPAADPRALLEDVQVIETAALQAIQRIKEA